MGVMQDLMSKILSNDNVAEDVYRLKLQTNFTEYQYGQFIMLKVPDFFLRRPFCIANLNNGELVIYYKVCGDGTNNLSKMKASESVSVLGPLGKGFSISNPDAFIAGGYGLAPFVGWIEKMNEKRPTLYYGSANKNSMFCLDELNEKVDLKIATDDGSLGDKGLVTDLLDGRGWSGKSVCACGPTPMLKCLAIWAEKNSVKLEVSIESRMGCGWGACLGCAVPSSDGGYVHACKDGPVFDYRKIDWDKIGI